MNFTWFYRICKRREKRVETVSQLLERLARRERFRDELIGLALVAGICVMVAASCNVVVAARHSLGY